MINYGTTLIQAFAPHEILTNVTTLDTTNVKAIRVAADTQYQINGAGPTGTMFGVTAIQTGVNSIVFSTPQTIEVMR